jgi:hypothetical protein
VTSDTADQLYILSRLKFVAVKSGGRVGRLACAGKIVSASKQFPEDQPMLILGPELTAQEVLRHAQSYWRNYS